MRMRFRADPGRGGMAAIPMILKKYAGRAASGALAALTISIPGGCSTLLVDSYDYGTIEVEALMESGEPAAGIPLELYRNKEILAYGATNSAGKFTFSYVPFGVVGVYVQLAPEYETMDSRPSDYRDNIDLSDGGRTSLVFTGIRRTEPPPGQVTAAGEDRF